MNSTKTLTRLAATRILGSQPNSSFEVEVHVWTESGMEQRALVPDELQRACSVAVDSVSEALRTIILAEDPNTAKYRKIEKEQIRSLFVGELIYMEPVRNEYWGTNPRGEAFPWYRVTTRIGHFTVGWRKRVIQLDWSATLCEQTAEDLFPESGNTKTGCGIHAWSLEEARGFVNRIFEVTSATEDL